MSQISAPLIGFCDYRLVALSIFIAISASYAALDLGGRVTAAHGWIRSVWLVVEAIGAGKRFLTPKLTDIVLERSLKTGTQLPLVVRNGARITPRETEITRLLDSGKTNKEIAAFLQIKVRTVETHRARVIPKVGTHSLAELIHYAMRHGIATT
jgi:DNA-binding NarL/FixJ family response regulator